jgi:mRNA-degrading endonuclease HigB of HigAB toxin-antitoxin module
MSVTTSSSHDRIGEITKKIANSKFTLHDLSRHRSSKKNEIARFNMPFELGIDFGCYMFKPNRKDKVMAILDSDPHTYDQHLSDMSGRDILSHNNNPDLLFEIIPTWLSKNTYKVYDSPKKLKGIYSSWTNDYKVIMKNHGYDLRTLSKMDIQTYRILIENWVEPWKVANNYTNP